MSIGTAFLIFAGAIVVFCIISLGVCIALSEGE